MPGRKLQATCGYTELGKLQYVLGQKGFPILESIFEEKVTLFILIPEEALEGCKKALTEAAGGRVELVEKEAVYYGEVQGKIQVFS